MKQWPIDGLTVVAVLYPLFALYQWFMYRYFFTHGLRVFPVAIETHYGNICDSRNAARLLAIFGVIGTIISLAAGQLTWHLPAVTLEAIAMFFFTRALLDRFVQRVGLQSS